MTALADKRAVRLRKFSTFSMAATASVTYYQGAALCLDTSTGLVVQGKASATLIPIGLAAESVTLGGGGGNVSVNLFREITAVWMANLAADLVTTAEIGKVCYLADDQTVRKTDNSNANSVFGRVWAIDSVKGVLVEPMQTAGANTNSGLDF